MKTTVDIPEDALRDAMRYAKARTKREAILTAIEEFNRRKRVEDLVANFGTLDFASNDEIEAGDLEEMAARSTERSGR
ncbi:type II toxin-antitoxin system VapB family antitoxin [Haloferula sp. A504]|uniref:type II toxin-antitoxin system VapB family antitoxin n=1 Tax=Haloferula sp. A504 TaxID=3373601 RepID=UPI0031BF986C|nr:type II toxin-antitoxin system VapB family antitoxin [Verrucomicrobiaceae bacterium E54]